MTYNWFHLPDYSSLALYSSNEIEWWNLWFENGRYRKQERMPVDTKEWRKSSPLKELNGCKVLVYAGGPGNWSKLLEGYGAHILHTDIVRSIVEYTKKTKKLDCLVTDATRLSVNLEELDWLFSFEPLFTTFSEPPFLVALQGLKTRKGIITINPYGHKLDITVRTLSDSNMKLYLGTKLHLAKLKRLTNVLEEYYIADLEEKRIRTFHTTLGDEQNSLMLYIKTNNKCKKKASTDLGLIDLLNSDRYKRRFRFSSSEFGEICKRLGINKQEGLEALTRIDLILLSELGLGNSQLLKKIELT